MKVYYIYEGSKFHRLTWDLQPFISDLQRIYKTVEVVAGAGASHYATITAGTQKKYYIHTEYKGEKL